MPFLFSLVQQVSNKIGRGCGTCLEHKGVASNNYSEIIFFFFAESVSSPWQKPTLFFKVGKQLKTLITKSAQTVADFRIRSLGSQKGYGFLISLVFILISHTAWDLSVLSWIETQQVTSVFHLKFSPSALEEFRLPQDVPVRLSQPGSCSAPTALVVPGVAQTHSLLVSFWYCSEGHKHPWNNKNLFPRRCEGFGD